MLTKVDSYLALRRSLGFKLEKNEQILRSFAEFCGRLGEPVIKAERAIEWSAQAGSPAQRARRLRTIADLADYLRAEEPGHERVPRDRFPGKRLRREPHLFSDEEIRRLLAAAQRLGPRGSLRPLALHSLFALLACTGLRISEALGLKFEHITDDGLFVANTKFRKSRFVPLHPSARLGLERYLLVRRRVEVPHGYVFISLSGRPLRRDKAEHAFLDLLRATGLRSARPAQGPHLHDLRHTFAVRALEAAPSERELVGKHILALSTYLGHAHVSDTFWYLHATPLLMKAMAQASGALVPGGAL